VVIKIKKERYTMVNETTSFNGDITVKDSNGVDTMVAYLSATLDEKNENLNINMNVTNKELLNANATDAKSQYDEFETAVKSRAKDLGYVVF
jgi:hypothetical protein